MGTYTFQSLVNASQSEWEQYTQHEFVQELAKGTLATNCFQYYLQQDYIFLINYSRAWGLAIYKSHTIGEISTALNALKTLIEVELDLHINYCQQWGVDEAKLLSLAEATANIAYTRYILDIGHQGTLRDLRVALSACVIGYGHIANWLNKQPWLNRTNNPYSSWIEKYSSEAIQTAVQEEISWLDSQLMNIDADTFNHLTTIFKNVCKLEAHFWQMSLLLAD